MALAGLLHRPGRLKGDCKPIVAERREGNGGLFHLSQGAGSKAVLGLSPRAELQAAIITLISQMRTPSAPGKATSSASTAAAGCSLHLNPKSVLFSVKFPEQRPAFHPPARVSSSARLPMVVLVPGVRGNVCRAAGRTGPRPSAPRSLGFELPAMCRGANRLQGI